MRGKVYRLDISQRRRALLGYVVGAAVYTFVVVALYPSFKNSTSLDALTKGGAGTAAALFGVSGSLTSPGGWLDANLYGNLVPLMVLLLGIGYGAACVAGQDAEGTLGLVATLPVRRSRLLLEKVAVLATLVVVVATSVSAFVLVGRGFAVMVDPWHVLALTGSVSLLGLDFGLVAVLVGSWTGRQGLATGVATAVAAASYLVSSLSSVAAWIRPARYASLFFWSLQDQQITRGVSFADLVVLLGVAALILAATLAAFERLDLH